MAPNIICLETVTLTLTLNGDPNLNPDLNPNGIVWNLTIFTTFHTMERHHRQNSTLKRMYQIINSYIFKWAYFQMNERTFERTNVLLN